MVFVAAAGLLFLSAAQVASALLFNFTDVEQCAPVLIGFKGRNITVTPERLWLLPINSTATSIPLGDPAVYSTGISLPFVPYAADTTFLASIDDANGIHVLLTSNITTVLPSPTGNSSCVSVSNDAVPRHFSLTSSANQCEPITVKYDNTVVSKAPTVRLYSPNGTTFRLAQLSDDPATGTATYMLNFFTGKEILLLMDEGNGTQETTPLITVGGNAFNRSCFSNQTNTTSTVTEGPNSTSGVDPDDLYTSSTGETATLSKAVIIGSATGGSAVVFIALSMAIFVVQERKKRLLKESASLIEKGSPPSSSFNNGSNPGSPEPGASTRALKSMRSNGSFGTFAGSIPNPFTRERDDGAVVNPPYTSNSLYSSVKSPNSAKVRGSMASWAQAIPEDQLYPASRNVSPRPGSGSAGEFTVSTALATGGTQNTSSRLSLESLDIEGMLNMATLQSERAQLNSRKNSDATILTALPSPAPAALLNGNNGNGNGNVGYFNQMPTRNNQGYLASGPQRDATRATSPADTIATLRLSPSLAPANASSSSIIPQLGNSAPPQMPAPVSFLRPEPTRSRGNRHSPLDLPMAVEPQSMAFSGYNITVESGSDRRDEFDDEDDGNPFNASPLPIPVPLSRPPLTPLGRRGAQAATGGDPNYTGGGSSSARFIPSPLRTGDSFKIAQATSGGLPVSPSPSVTPFFVVSGGPDGARVDSGGNYGTRESVAVSGSGFEPGARRSSADWYGIAR